jgi:hypothetical protein
MHGDIQNGQWTIFWPDDSLVNRMVQFFGDRARAQTTRQEMFRTILPHEIGHQMVDAWLSDDSADASDGEHSHLPAWYQEGAAVWLESSDNRSVRFAKAKQLLSSADPHRDILREVQIAQHADSEMTFRGYHAVLTRSPCSNPATCGQPHPTETQRITKFMTSDGQLRADTVYLAEPQPPAPETDSLYSLAYALMLYVHDLYGVKGVARLGNVLHAQPTRDIGSVFADDSSMTDSAWRVWIVSRDSTLP